MSTLCAGCGHDSITGVDHRGAVASSASGPQQRRQAVRHRLLVEDDRRTSCERRTASTACTAACRRWPTGANAANSEPALHRRVGRRRFALDRLRPVRARDPPQRQHALHLREQRRLRSDQGAVLGVSRCRQQDARRARRIMQAPVDPVLAALSLGGSFIARSFSGDERSSCR